MNALYQHGDYKAFLKEWLKANSKIRGHKKRLAEAAGCHMSYLSQVIHNKVHLTPEHSLKIAAFLNLSELETSYFLHLVHYARAGTVELRQLHKKELEKIRASSRDLSERLGRERIETEQMSLRYYSAWYYAAIHILTTIEKFQSVGGISSRLFLSPFTTERVLIELSQMGLVHLANGRWRATKETLHLPKDSGHVWSHHANWRMKALENVGRASPVSLHFSGVHSASSRTYQAILEELYEVLERVRKSVVASESEEIFVLNLDAFPL